MTFSRHNAGRRLASVLIATIPAAVALVLSTTSGCGASGGPTAPQKLSQYGLFEGNGRSQRPTAGVIPYDLNTPLFSDYTDKFRFIKLPPGTAAQYQENDNFEFPVGTIIAKTFAYPLDEREPELGRRLLETRILKREPAGWVGWPYVWNAEQTEATLDVAGDTVDVEWIDAAGNPRTNNYIVPNVNQCKGCHKQGSAMQPIGPKARHFNRDFVYAGGLENQLTHWTKIGALAGAPEPAEAPRAAVWNDPATGSVAARARAWLEINCAHCHNPAGPARTSGLDLVASQKQGVPLGIRKPPVAAGRGTGNRRFDIVPGKPDESIFLYRMESTDAGIMMPELGKRMIHAEGVALVRQWIAEMQDKP